MLRDPTMDSRRAQRSQVPALSSSNLVGHDSQDNTFIT